MADVFRGVIPGATADLAQVRRALAILADPENGVQLQFAPFHRRSWSTFRGDQIEDMAAWVASQSHASGIYYALNPVRPDLAASLKVGDVLRRRWLLIDVDRDKALCPDDSATAEEKERARVATGRIRDWLTGVGWPEPVEIDSGNGWHLLYRIDLPNTGGRSDRAHALIKDILEALDWRFPASQGGAIGTECHDARRIAKLPGTMARRGTSSEDRPHRLARLVHVPECVEVLTEEKIRETLATLTEARQRQEQRKSAFEGVVPSPAQTSAEQRAIEYLRTIPLAKSGEHGSDPTYWAARCVVYGFDLGPEIGLRLLLDHYNPRCLPPWSEHELRHKCEDADTKPFHKPRGWLLESSDRANGQTHTGNGQKPASEGASPAPPDKPITVCMADIVPKSVEWLVPDRIPKRFITVFAGRTGVGKSAVSLDLVARLTRGDEIPCVDAKKFDPGNVLLISEDSHEYVLAPRLLVAGADMARVWSLTWEAMGAYSLGETKLLDQALKEMGSEPALIVIDPPTNFLGDTVDEHKNSDVRQTVMNVVKWLQDKDVAVIFVLHVNKNCGKGVEALSRVMGSVAWVTTSRIAHSFSHDPNDSSRSLWVPMKSNIGLLAKGLAYRVVDGGGSAKVEWIGEVDITADEAMQHEAKPKRKRRIEAADWLEELFAEEIEITSNTIFNRTAEETNISRNALLEAKDDMGIRAYQHADTEGRRLWSWEWTLENRQRWEAKKASQGTPGNVRRDAGQRASGERDNEGGEPQSW